MAEDFRAQPKHHLIIAVKTADKRRLFFRLHDLASTVSIVDEGAYPDDATISRVKVVSRLDEREMDRFLYDNVVEYLRMTTERIETPTEN